MTAFLPYPRPGWRKERYDDPDPVPVSVLAYDETEGGRPQSGHITSATESVAA